MQPHLFDALFIRWPQTFGPTKLQCFSNSSPMRVDVLFNSRSKWIDGRATTENKYRYQSIDIHSMLEWFMCLNWTKNFGEKQQHIANWTFIGGECYAITFISSILASSFFFFFFFVGYFVWLISSLPVILYVCAVLSFDRSIISKRESSIYIYSAANNQHIFAFCVCHIETTAILESKSLREYTWKLLFLTSTGDSRRIICENPTIHMNRWE